MAHKPLHGKASITGSEPQVSSPPPENAAEVAVFGEPAGETVENSVEEPDPDPYDELWDPDMDTRPERIRKTRIRARTDARPRGGGPPRGKRSEGL